MGDKTAIEWCDATFNPWWGCAKVSPGCDHCYAEAWAKRTGTAKWGVDEPRRTFGDKHWNAPLNWSGKLSAKLARRPRVFCASMADVFDKNAPEGARERLWKLISATPGMDWLLLTKRIGNVQRMLPVDWGGGWANVWLGISVVNQEEADRDIPKLLTTPARIRFLSCEPLLGPINLTNVAPPNLGDENEYSGVNAITPYNRSLRGVLDWVISGGESGAEARPSHPEWHRSLRDQCAAAGVPFLFKQWGEWIPGETDVLSEPPGRVVYPDDESIALVDGRGYRTVDAHGREFIKVGKKVAGRTLDGRTHDGYPA